MRLLKSFKPPMKMPLVILPPLLARPAARIVESAGKFKARAACAFVSCCLVLICVSGGAAQRRGRDALPRVGVIKDHEQATQAIRGGCDNHFLKLAGDPGYDKNIYISTADGSIAWMNLDGRDTRLEPVKTTLRYRSSGDAFVGDAFARHEYRAGRTLITVSFWQLSDYVFEYPAQIVIRRGRAVRRLRATGLPQCD